MIVMSLHFPENLSYNFLPSAGHLWSGPKLADIPAGSQDAHLPGKWEGTVTAQQTQAGFMLH